MTRLTFFLFYFFSSLSLYSCRENNVLAKRPIHDKDGLHIGDSLFKNEDLEKIIFTDYNLKIDSIVFKRFPSPSRRIKSVNTYIKEKKGFENILYYESGQIKSYQFLDPDCDNCFFIRDYDEFGNLISSRGDFLFQCYIDGIDSKTSSVRSGTTLRLNLFYAKPPNCSVFTFSKFPKEGKVDFFHQNKFISFAKYVSVDVEYKGKESWRRIEIGVEIKDSTTNKLDSSIQSLIYQVLK